MSSSPSLCDRFGGEGAAATAQITTFAVHALALRERVSRQATDGRGRST